MAFARPKKREPSSEAELFDYAVRTLARRMRTVRDLRRLMKLRAEEGEAGERTMDAVVARLEELNYLSDTRFAADYTRLRKDNEKFGRRRVQQDLMQKGVQQDLVATTLATAYDDVDEVALARAYIARKRMKQPGGDDAQKETVRTMNRLMRAGFSSTAIFKVLRAWVSRPRRAIWKRHLARNNTGLLWPFLPRGTKLEVYAHPAHLTPCAP